MDQQTTVCLQHNGFHAQKYECEEISMEFGYHPIWTTR